MKLAKAKLTVTLTGRIHDVVVKQLKVPEICSDNLRVYRV